MPRRTIDQQILDLEAKIQSIKARAERKKVRANPAVRFMSMGLRAIDKALNATEDAVLRKALDEARETVSSCLALCGAKPKAGKRTLTPRPRATNVGGPTTAAKLDGAAVLTYVRNNPGQRSEDISAAFSTDAGTLRATMKALIEAGQVRTEGEKRGTRYYAAEERAKAKAQ